ncbi:MAG: iron hydrogenase small subunit [Deltaproteobacteria bacterium]|nr:iron hydrogenase small subunit [Deltaproteobacteria bacterium]
MAEVELTINDIKVNVAPGTTVLQAAKKIGVRIPTLCYDEKLSVSGACRLCVIEVLNPDGTSRLEPSCSYPVQQGMEIRTNTQELRDARRTIIELILANHPRACQTCIRNGRCQLQAACREYSIDQIRYAGGEKRHFVPDDSSVALTRHPDFCILCGKCVKVCREVQTVYALDFANRGFQTTVLPASNRDLAETVCVLCGQCLLKCPVAAIRDKSYIQKVEAALVDPSIIVTVQIAPSVRVTIGELFGLPAGTSLTRKIPEALRRLGFNYIFDTDFGADMAVMEEGYELIKRIKNDGPYPLITSCSPGWVKYMEHFYPEFIPNMSSTKSPQQIVGTLTKTFFAQRIGVNPQNIFNVSIMPCSAKKFEIQRPEHNQLNGGLAEVDAVLTTREFGDLLKLHEIDIPVLPDSPFDDLLGTASGAGLMFGVAGGMMEAALRTVATVLDPNNEPRIEYSLLRGTAGIKKGSVIVGDRELKLCAVHGLGNARQVLDDIKTGKEEIHFLEVMACPGGCIGGGGQPLPTTEEIRKRRVEAMYSEDRNMGLRLSHKNPAVQEIYAKFLNAPLSEKAHHLLHTFYGPRKPRGC